MLLKNQPLKVSQKIVYSSAAIALAAITATGSAQAATIVQNRTLTVSGQANPWLAGTPSGTISRFGGDRSFSGTNRRQSPVEVSLLDGAVREFTFSNVTGTVGNSATSKRKTADGTSGAIDHRGGAENGISDIRSPQNALVGVFLSAMRPDATAPAAINYSSVASRNLTTYSPLLEQVFFIGDGLTNLGELQRFFAPKGATRLFLGTMDSYKWNDNVGSFQVSLSQKSVPEPTTIIGTLAFGALGAGSLLKRKRKAIAL